MLLSRLSGLSRHRASRLQPPVRAGRRGTGPSGGPGPLLHAGALQRQACRPLQGAQQQLQQRGQETAWVNGRQ